MGYDERIYKVKKSNFESLKKEYEDMSLTISLQEALNYLLIDYEEVYSSMYNMIGTLYHSKYKLKECEYAWLEMNDITNAIQLIQEMSVSYFNTKFFTYDFNMSYFESLYESYVELTKIKENDDFEEYYYLFQFD